MAMQIDRDEKNAHFQIQEVTYVSENGDYSDSLKLKPEDVCEKKADTFFMYFAVLSVELLVVLSGANVVWTSPVLLKLSSNDTSINPVGKPLSSTEISVIAGTPVLTGLVGSLLLPKLADIIGRKLYLQIIGAILLVLLTLLAFSKSVIQIIACQSMLGFILAGSYSVIPIYITEICEDHNRAKFGCFTGLSHQLGHFYGFAMGPVLSYRNFTLLIGATAIPFLLFSLFTPESPVYLMSKNKKKDCTKALTKLRSNKSIEEIKIDLNTLEQSIRKNQGQRNASSILSLFRNKETKVGLILAILPLMVQHLSGIAVLMGFLAPFFDSAGTSFSGNTLGTLIGLVKISTFTFTSFVVERVGRKRMLLISAFGTGIPLFGVASFFYLKHVNSPYTHQLQWCPLIFMLSYVFIYSIGLGPIPVAVMHEMFPSEYRAVAGSFIMTFVNSVIFVLISSFPFVVSTIGTHWAIWMFSFNCFFGAILIYYFLPETKGKSLQEIQELLKNY